MIISGRVHNGVIAIGNEVSLPEGMEVTVVVPAEQIAAGERVPEEERRRIRDIMDRIASLPDENPGDTISGARIMIECCMEKFDGLRRYQGLGLEAAMTQNLDVEKAIQAVGVLLRREEKHVSRLRLLKLLYIADRISLEKTGSPIIGSKLVAMKNGPLHSEVLDLINGNHLGEPSWSRHFRNVGRDIVLEDEPDIGKLSRFEIQLLNQVVEDRINLSDWDVADETHGFAEWQTVYPDPKENTSRPIPIELLIDAVGRGGDKESILQDLRDSDAFDQLFSEIGR